MSYDTELASGYADFFSSAKGAKVGSELHLMPPEALTKAVKAGEAIEIIDIRTPEETRFVTAALPDSVTIPLNELFLPENLSKIPTDKKIVIMCLNGTRASAAATALRHIGFDNAYILQGGIQGLISYLTPATCCQP